MDALENTESGYVRFAVETVDTFVVGNGRLPSMDFVMTHLRHTSILHGYGAPGRDVFSLVAQDLQTQFPTLNLAASAPS